MPAPWHVTLDPSPMDHLTVLTWAVAVIWVPRIAAVAVFAVHGPVHNQTGTPTAPMHPGPVQGADPMAGLGSFKVATAKAASSAGEGGGAAERALTGVAPRVGARLPRHAAGSPTLQPPQAPSVAMPLIICACVNPAPLPADEGASPERAACTDPGPEEAEVLRSLPLVLPGPCRAA